VPGGRQRQRRRTTSCVTFAVSALQALAWCAHARADEGGAVDEGGTSELAESGASDNAGWTLTFDDEFDESSIDFCKWQLRQKWGEKVVNNEREAYVSAADASEAFTFDNGLLHIVARKQPGLYGGVIQPYTSGLLASVHNQKYGYYETRSRMPSGSGLWPAFWLLHTPAYPDIHEIDIMEWISLSPDVVFMTDHFGTNYDTNSFQSQVTVSATDFTTAFHVFGLDWEADRIIWYADGIEVGRVTSPNTLHDVEMYVVVNLAVGGDLPGDPEPNAVFPASYDVDYVRVFQRNPSNPDGPPPFGPSTSIPASLQRTAGEECPDEDAGDPDASAGDATDGSGNTGVPPDARAAPGPLSASARGGCNCSTTPAQGAPAFALLPTIAAALAIARRRLPSRPRARS
jgi:MYXO-CTERM domain-containing protein